MLNDIKIERGFTRKLNLGNYESLDIWSSRTIELPDDTPKQEQKIKSQEIWQECFNEVMEKINSFKGQKEGFDPVKVCHIIDNLNKNGNMGSVEDYEKLTPQENMVVKSADLLRKRLNRQELKSQEEHIKDIKKEEI